MIYNLWASRNNLLLYVKFNRHPKVDTLISDNFRLFVTQEPDLAIVESDDQWSPSVEEEDPTKELVAPFKSIDSSKDYNSISRTLILKLKNPLDAETHYRLYTSSAIRNAAGINTLTDAKVFKSQYDSGGPSIADPDPVHIEDYSILPGSGGSGGDVIDSIGGSPNGFTIVESDPVDGDYFVEQDHNSGKITIYFSQIPDSNYLNEQYIKVQRKKNQIAPIRWETLSVGFFHDAKQLSIDFPEIYDQIYFEEGYIYRIKLSRHILQATSVDEPSVDLGADVIISFSSGFSPLLVDPESIAVYVDDVSNLEIAQLVHRFSLEVVRLFGNGPYPEAVYDYIIAATLCALSRKYEGFGASSSAGFSLGDLQIRDQESGSKNRGDATSWCEMAELLRQELRTAKGGLMSARKAGNRPTPVPSRIFKKTTRHPHNIHGWH
jgi:hypothetical protein